MYTDSALLCLHPLLCAGCRSEKTLEDEELKKLLQTALKPKKKNKKKTKKVPLPLLPGGAEKGS